ncbi:MAG: bifunctional hydroxymethylpyrimidine kinase/phosphomethylpyrimidine kinase [Kiritimatiellaeota bacterium]|nr:bifunctional hydroxymethylpyrimidine kinase/phosphomethylpyrimidine kinase [Kiritimatiellota bacterium]
MAESNNYSDFYPVAMTIAGSDSGGGAGVQADLRAFSAYGVFGTSVITAVTAQNPREVRGVESVPPEFVSAQIAAVSAKFAVRCVKTGMLVSAETVSAVSTALRDTRFTLVIDPVMISGSGTPLINSNAVETLKNELLPLADWITPNIPEAEALLGRPIHSIADMKSAAAEIAETWRTGCVLKGGHLPTSEKEAVDIVAYKGKTHLLTSPRLEFSANLADAVTHGTGCTFSAAMAAGIAIELPWKDTLIAAKAFVFGSLAESVATGSDLACMYPPSGNHRDKVKLSKI